MLNIPGKKSPRELKFEKTMRDLTFANRFASIGRGVKKVRLNTSKYVPHTGAKQKAKYKVKYADPTLYIKPNAYYITHGWKGPSI